MNGLWMKCGGKTGCGAGRIFVFVWEDATVYPSVGSFRPMKPTLNNLIQRTESQQSEIRLSVNEISARRNIQGRRQHDVVAIYAGRILAKMELI
jgi:hypothetical protein